MTFKNILIALRHGWLYFYSGICFKFIWEWNTWSDSRDECRKIGGDLFSIHSEEEQNIVKSKIFSFNIHKFTDD